jgi:hypothetical protein
LQQSCPLFASIAASTLESMLAGVIGQRALADKLAKPWAVSPRQTKQTSANLARRIVRVLPISARTATTASRFAYVKPGTSLTIAPAEPIRATGLMVSPRRTRQPPAQGPNRSYSQRSVDSINRFIKLV